jgi:DNA-binding IclR family transcriptional regulator
VPNLERALAILEHLAAHPHPLGITEIAEALKLPKNSVFRIASTLAAHGYLRREDATKQYALGTKLLTLGYAAVHEGNLVEKSIDIMRQVRDETGETVGIGILDGTEGVVLDQTPTNHQVKVLVSVGSRFPLHTAAPGKAMLACLANGELTQILDQLRYPKFTDRTIGSRQAMLGAIDETRARGYAIDYAEHNEGIHCVGAAVVNQRKYPVGAIWITGPSFRVKPEQFDRLGRIVAAAAVRISRRFGFSQ